MSEYSEIAVLAASMLMLLAIVAKLIISNLVARAKKNWTRLDLTRREIIGRLKKAQLARTSAQGTLEFWERRRQEAGLKVAELGRDLEAYAEQFGDGVEHDGESEPAGGDGAEGELASTAAGEGGDGDAGPAESLEGAEPTESLDGDEAVDGEGAPSDGDEEAAAAEVAGAETTVESQPDPDVKVE